MGELDLNWLVLAPALTLLIAASVALIVALYVRSSQIPALLSFAGLGVATAFTLRLFAQAQEGAALSAFGLRYVADVPALAVTLIILLATALSILLSYNYLRRTGLEHPEYYPLMLLASCGGVVLVSAGDLITMLLGLEIMSLAIYVLTTWSQERRESEEAGMKYFLLGAFASAFLIYGIAFLYGATGQFIFTAIAAAVFAPEFDQTWLALLGAMILLAGLAFKVALAPFHQWAPDVYTGAPTPVVAFMGVIVKAAAFAAILRVFAVVFADLPAAIFDALAVLVALTLIVANFSALLQRGVKRLLGYSAVAHGGYLGLAVLAADTVGVPALVYYLLAYTFMSIGAFAVLVLVSDEQDKGDELERFAGLGRTRPYLAAAMTLFMLSLTGIPLTAGFIGKVLVFQAAIQAGYLLLAVIGILTSVVAAWYYFRIVFAMYFRESEHEPRRHEDKGATAVVALAVIGTLLFGLLPGWWYGLLQVGQQLLAVSP
jgi:NADH-quinone oxidoreductase subunit N